MNNSKPHEVQPSSTVQGGCSCGLPFLEHSGGDAYQCTAVESGDPKEHPRADCEGCGDPKCPCNYESEPIGSTVQGEEPNQHRVQIALRRIMNRLLDVWDHHTFLPPSAAQEGREVVEPKPADGWISVKDRLPDEAKSVLVFVSNDDQGYYVAALYGERWNDESTGSEVDDGYADPDTEVDRCVTHWQFLTQPLEATHD